MNKQSLFFTVIVAIVALMIMLLAIQIFSKRLGIKNDSSQKINTSFAIWIVSIFIPFFIFLKIALELIENSIEILIKMEEIDNTFFAVMEKISIFMGFTFLFTFLSYYLTERLLQFILGNRITSIEIEKDNIGYFLIKGFTLVLLVFSLSPIFDHFLRWFMPVVSVPFYH